MTTAAPAAPVAEAPASAPEAAPMAPYEAPPIEAAPEISDTDMGKALDELFQMNDVPTEAPKDAAPDAVEASAPTDQAPPARQEPAIEASPHLIEIERLKTERTEMMGLMRELVARSAQPQQQAAQQQPTDDRARFEAALRAQNLNIDKPEVVDTTNKTLNAWFQANTGKTAGEFFGEYSQMKRALANMASNSAADADRNRTMQELAEMKAREGFDALGADREHMTAAYKKYIPQGADSSYAAPANIPPHLLARLAKLDKMEAAERSAADATQRAQAAKQGAKPTANAATPAPANATAGKGMAEGVQFTDAQLAKLDMGELLRRMNLFGS